MTDIKLIYTDLIYGIVGSRAYGLDHADSDTDYLGIFAYDTEQLFRLDDLELTLKGNDPDFACHEAKKFCKLAMKGNPTVLELLYLTNYETLHWLGKELIDIRHAFLSKSAVMNSYLGYADQQFKKLEARSDGKFDSDTGNRFFKHAVHLLRLLDQGHQLYTEGRLVVKVQEPERLRSVASFYLENPKYFGEKIATTKADMYRIGSPLPDQPNTRLIEDWLQQVRREFYTA